MLDHADVMACVDAALGRACVDPMSKGYCTPLVKACDPNAGGPGSSIDEAGCESFANGFTASGRTALAACLESKIAVGTCPTEVVTCADEPPYPRHRRSPSAPPRPARR